MAKHSRDAQKMTSIKKRELRTIRHLLVLWVFLLALFVPQYAYAYIDPATTTYLIQIATALVITLGVSFSIVLYRFRMIFAKVWVRVTSFVQGKYKTSGEADSKISKRRDKEAAYVKPAYVLLGSPNPPQKEYGFVSDEEQATIGLADNDKAAQKQASLDTHKDMRNENSATSKQSVNGFKEKLEWLLNDQRAFKTRLVLAALVCASLVFTVLVFGPLELFATSRSDMLFDLSDIIGALLLVAFFALLIMTGALIILRGRLFDVALCIASSIALGCYIQASFFNGFIGELTGDLIQWHDYTGDAIVNILVWLAIFLIFILLRFFNTKSWQIFVASISALLIVVQFVALVSLSADLTRRMPNEDKSLVLTAEGTLELSESKNIVVFLLDRLDRDYIDVVKEQDPHFFDDLNGFVEYPDNMTRYWQTFPSVAYSLTGLENNYDIPRMDYFDLAYDEHMFVDDLKSEGWATKLYLSEGYDFGHKSQLVDRASNLKSVNDVLQKESQGINFTTSLRLVKRLDQLSAFRYAPIGLKAVFWMPSTDVSQVVLDERNEFSSAYQLEFMQDLKAEGISSTIKEPVFIYYHLDGPHGPNHLMADGTPIPEGVTDPIEETIGCFSIIYEYIRQLKELGIYEETCIIITGDHGATTDRTGLFFKPMGASTEPLLQSFAPVSDKNLVPTIIRESGISSTATAAQGFSYSDVTTENTPVRIRDLTQGSEADGVYTFTRYEVTGSTREPENWHVVSQSESSVDYWQE